MTVTESSNILFLIYYETRLRQHNQNLTFFFIYYLVSAIVYDNNKGFKKKKHLDHSYSVKL